MAKYVGPPASEPDDIITLANLLELKATTITVVNVVTGEEERPEGYLMVFWLGGTSRPTEMLDTDIQFMEQGAPTETPPTITTTALNALVQSTAFTQTISASGTSPITWALIAGSLPTGLDLNEATGTISGTPTVTGAYSFTLEATNGIGSDTQAFTGTVAATGTAPVITTTSLNAMTQNSAFSHTLAVTGSTPITWGISAGTIPTGLGINSSSGLISGTPTGSGAYDFTVQASNSFGSDTQQYTGTIAADSVTVTSSVYKYGVPSDMTSHNDGGDGNWLGHGFYFVSGLSLTGVKITGIRVYVHEGSSLIGFTGGRVSLSRSSVAQSPLSDGDFESGAILNLPALVAGWNTVTFPTPYDALQYMAVAYELNGNYLYGGDKMGVSSGGAFGAGGDGILFRSMHDDEGEFSSVYDGASSTSFFYGIEPIVQYPSAYPPKRPGVNYTRKTPFHKVGNPSPTHTVNIQSTSSGALLLLVLSGSATVTTPSGWTKVGEGVGDGATYVFSKTASAGETSVTVTAAAANYSLIGAVYEYPPGTTVAAAADADALGATANQPSVTVPSTGTYDIFQVRGITWSSGLIGTRFDFVASGGFTDLNIGSVADFFPNNGGAQVTVGIWQNQSLTGAASVASAAVLFGNSGTPTLQQAISILLDLP